MDLLTCPCGQTFDGTDQEAIYHELKAHADSAHPELGLQEPQVRDFIAAAFRLAPVGPRLETIAPPVVKALAPELLPDFLHFFDYEGFAGNPAWASCYCAFYLFAGSDAEWECSTAASNRALTSAKILAGEAHGYLAYVDDQVAGWCHAAPRSHLPGLDRRPEFITSEPAATGVTACFLIAPPYRRHGLSEALLDRALTDFKATGLRHAEAYPRKGTHPDGGYYHGPRSMYDARGYEVTAESDLFWVMRKAL